MTDKTPISIFWMRRDLRLEDNAALFHALKGDHPVVPLFIFDKDILDKLEEKKDARVQFIHQELVSLQNQLQKFGSDIDVRYGVPAEVWKELLNDYKVAQVFTNRDYEPYARKRDTEISALLKDHDIAFSDFKDHVIFDRDEIVKDNGSPYTVYTPFSKKWLAALTDDHLKSFSCKPYYDRFYQYKAKAIPALSEMGFEKFEFDYPDRTIDLAVIKKYADQRNFPGITGTSRLSMHLRFGTLSIRELTRLAQKNSQSWLNELIWRNFYQVIIWHFPESAEKAFKPAYDRIPWRNDEKQFRAWRQGRTGYPIVDAGMRELNETGFMHNRVRMVVASFLTKHLLIDWRWGEAYFAKKLLDFELASNNGGWQWAAGSGCDAAPYFRVFNPTLQTEKFDPDFNYIKTWVPEFRDSKYPEKIVDHKEARELALSVYKSALNS